MFVKIARFGGLRIWRTVRARPRLLLSLLIGLLVAWGLPWALSPWGEPLAPATRVLLAWDCGALTYLGLAWLMMLRASHEQIRRRALHQDDGRWVVLGLGVVAAVAGLLAVGSQLVMARELPVGPRAGHTALAALTVLLAWLLTQTTFALHYAHDFYVARSRGEPDALVFPGTPEPRYIDFLYFACVIGTSGQTADVSFVGSGLRATGLLHCVLAYFFNATVLALAINIAASLF